MPWQVVIHPEAEVELRDVRGAQGLRELRPRQGRSPWRALYGQKNEVLIVVAIAPEAEMDHRGFERAIRRATVRLAEAEV